MVTCSVSARTGRVNSGQPHDEGRCLARLWAQTRLPVAGSSSTEPVAQLDRGRILLSRGVVSLQDPGKLAWPFGGGEYPDAR
jgi:hypothetical protein